MKKFVNFLTLMRIFATILLPFLWRVLSPAVLLVFVVVILLTDFFDGLLARIFHVQSLFGTIMDAVADKSFGIMIILILSTTNIIYIIPLMLEIGIALINLFGSIFGAITKSSFLGRIKMWFLGLAIFLGILQIYSSDIISFIHIAILIKILNTLMLNIDTLLFASIFLAAGSEFMVAVDYSRNIIKDLNKSNEKIEYKFKSKEELKMVLFDTEYCLKHKNEPFSKLLLKG